MANSSPSKTLILVAPELLQALPPEELAGGEVVRLVLGQDPITQIKTALQARASNPVEVLRIISPGEPGSILLAGHRITAASLATRSADLAAWSTGLAPGADILLYGSSIAARADGVALVNALASGTGRDVAASRNASGAGGDTLFEVTSGTIGASALADRAWQRSGVRLSTNQIQLAKNIGAFAALTNGSSIAVWGNTRFGGDQAKAPSGTGYSQIFSNDYAFAALKNDGWIAVWGNEYSGGDRAKAPRGTGYSQIFSNGGPIGGAFAPLKNDGLIAVWGSAGYGGNQVAAPNGTGFASIQTVNGFVPLTFDPTPSLGGAQALAATGGEFRNLYALSSKPGSVAAPRQPGDPLDLVLISPEILGSVPQEELAGARVVVLDAGEDVIGQVGAALQANPGATVVRLISHGEPGSLMLAGQRISLDTLEFRSEEIAAWRRHLAPGADILLYGCSVAGTAEGRLFVDSISSLVGVDVAASTDLSGSAPLGGDLVLEYATGPIQAFSNRFGSAWDASGLTLPVTFSHGGSEAAGALSFTSQSSDQFTLTNASPGFTFSSLSVDSYGNDAALVTTGIANPPLTTSSSTLAVFDTTVKSLAPTIAAGSKFSIDRDATFTSINGAGNVSISGTKFNSWTATLAGGSGTSTFSGVLTNGIAGANSPLALTVNQAGFTQILSGTNDYAGATKINAGSLQVNGKNTNSPVTINGGTLSGTGTVKTVALTWGKLAPGAATGILNTGDISFTGGTFSASLAGSSNYSQANVTGRVTLGSNTILNVNIDPAYTPAPGSYFTLINNDGTDAVSGTFKGLAEGAAITINSNKLFVSYKGGTGNDVVVSVSASAPLLYGPTVKITSSLGKLSSSQTAVLSFELSAASTDFTAADLSVTNGSLSGFQVVAGSNGKQYTATFTPATNTKAEAVIIVAAGSFSEAADSTKTNLSAASLTLPVDTTPPALVSLALANNGQVLNLLMSQPIANGQAGAPALPPSSAFALQADGQAVAINAIDANGTTLSLTLATPIAESVKQLTLTYTDPSASDDAAALQDLSGQDAATFTGVLSNVAPSVSVDQGLAPTPEFREGPTAAKVIAGSLKLSDSDSTAIANATVQISNGLTTGDLLSVTTTGTPITASYSAANGTLTLVGQASAATYQQVLSSISFSNTTDAPTSLSSQRSLSISVRDNGGSGLAPQTSTPLLVSFNVVGVNDGVTLNPTALNPSVTVKAGATAPLAGQLPSGAIKVRDLVRTGNGGNVTDPDGDQPGIAITGIAGGFTPHYSTNNGATWQAVGTVTNKSARLLYADDTTWLYLQPTTTNLATNPSGLTYRAWDRNTPSTVTTAYVNGQGAVNPGTGSTASSPSPFSTASDTLSVTVAGNASPILVTGLLGSLNPIPAISAAPQKGEIGRGTLVRDLIRDTQQNTPRELISDTDSQDARGIAITAVATGLELHFSTDNGANWSKANAPSATSSLLLLADTNTRVQLVSATPTNTASTESTALTFKAWDGNGTNLTNGRQGVNSNQSNGVIGGSPFSTTTATASLHLQKLNQAPGSLLSAGKAIIDLRTESDDTAYSVVTQTDGKVLIAGETNAQRSSGIPISDYGVLRLNANGSLDTNFGDLVNGVRTGRVLLDLGTNSGDTARSVVTQADGKVLIAGYTTAQPAGGTGGSVNYGVVRLNENGSLDTNFGDLVNGVRTGRVLLDLGTDSQDYASSVVTQTGGKILIAGYTKAQPAGGTGSSNNYGVVRLNENGSLDTNFGDLVNGVRTGRALLDLGTNSEDRAWSVVTQTDGKILIAGETNAQRSSGTVGSVNYGLVRLNENGSLDTNFGDLVNGVRTGRVLLDLGRNSQDYAWSVVTQTDGKILIAGETNAQPAGGTGGSDNYGVVRLNKNGSLDTNFGDLVNGVRTGRVLLDLGTNSLDYARSVVTQTDGKILIAGYTGAQPAGGTGISYNYGVVRLNENGSLDTNFGDLVNGVRTGRALLDLGTNSRDMAWSVVTQTDGKILIAGYTKAQPAGGTGSSNNYGVVRLNADGSLDTTFAPVTSLDGKVNYIIGNAAVQLGDDVRFRDEELTVLNNGSGNYAGASLVLQRDGTANPADVFSGLNRLELQTATGTNPGRIVLGSTSTTSSPLDIGSCIQANGSLELLFNSNATQAAVNEAASSIGYRFTGNTPPANPIQIRWTFSDGNTGSQGIGDPLALSTTGTTQVTIAAPPVDRTSSATLVSNTSLAVPTTAISAATAATVFELRLTDNDANADGIPNGGSSDGQSTLVNAISISLTRPGTASLAYQLRGPDLGAPVVGKLSADRTSLQFDLGSTPLSIADNSSETYSVEVWYASGSVVDRANLVTLSLNPPQQISLGTEGSQFNSSSPSLKRQLTGSVSATTFKILAPAQVVSGKANTFTVQAVDANGNLDKDATGTVNLQLASGAGRFEQKGGTSAPSAGLVGGVATFTELIYRASADGESFSLQAIGSGNPASLSSATTTAINADVVATKLELQGNPSTTTLQSGQASSLSGLSVTGVDADGVIDRQWLSGTGIQILDLFSNTNDQAYSVVTQDDGKILIAGYTTAQPAGGTGSSRNYGVVRLNANGSLDTGFGTNGRALLDLGTNSDDIAYSVVTQDDGKVLIAGYTTAQPAGGTGGSVNYGVVRLNENGSLDTNFGDLVNGVRTGRVLLDLGTDSQDYASSVVTQTGGKILIAGYTKAQPAGGTGSSNNYGVVRLNENGSLDTNFGDLVNGVRTGRALLDLGTDSQDYASSVVTQTGGKILIAGNTKAQPAGGTGSSNNYGVVRLNENGSLDTNFGDLVNGVRTGRALLDLATNSSDVAWTVVTQDDGKVLIAGYTNAQPAGGTGSRNNYGVVRLNADGSLDTSFGTNGRALLDLGTNSDDIAYSVVTQDDGKILIAGQTTAQPAGGNGGSFNYGVVRLNANGSLDTGFGTNGRALLDLGTNSDDIAYSVVTQGDGKVLIAGYTDAQPAGGKGYSYNYGVVRLNADGSLDTSFGAPILQLSLSGANNQTLAGTANALSLSSADSDSSPITITLDRNAVGSDGRIDLGSLQLSYTNATGSASDQLALKAERVGGSSLPVALGPLLTSSSTITPNTAPSLTLGSGTPAFTEAGGVNNASAGSGAVVVAPNAVLSDAEQANLVELKLTITNLQSGDQLALSNPPSGLTAKYVTSTGELSISGSATVAEYQAALGAVTYSNSSDSPDGSNRTIAITVNDGAPINSSTTVNQTITVTPQNDAPTLGTLAAIAATEDTPLALNLSGLAPADADGEATPLTLRLQVSQGNLKASAGAGVSVSRGSSGAELVVVGNASSLTSYLQSSNPVQFIPEAQAHGAVTLSYSLSDGSSLAPTTGSTTITVAAVNDAATFRSLPDSGSAAVVRVGQATPLQSLLPGPNPISVVDGDFNDYGAATTLTLTGFNLTLAGLVAGPQGSGAQLPGATLTIVNASTWQLRGTPAEINSVLENPAIRVQASAAGMKSLKLEIDDGSGLPGATTNATIEVQAISDPLLINSAATPGNAMNGAKDGETSLSFLSITNPDALTSAYSFLAESTYTLSLDASASNGQLIGLSDADPNQPGVQLKGTASQITTALAAGSFKPLADGSTSLALALQSALAPVITGSAFFQVTNPPPTLNQITPLVGAKEDQPFTISFADLSSAADDADKGGSVEGFVVKAISSGSLKIGSNESGASAWALGTNDRITPSLNAYWTPAANANGTGINAFTVTALDNSGGESSTPIAVKVDVDPVNDAPTISGVPTVTTVVNTGVSNALVDFIVGDIDSNALTLTLRPIYGSIGNLTDADGNRDGIQLIGSASSINAALVNATFTPATAGGDGISLRLEDGGRQIVAIDYSFLATKANTAPTLSTPGTTPRALTTGLADGLSYISVNDADTDQTLTLSLSASSGNFRDLADADSETSGIQLSGSVSAINAALAAGSFVASADGPATISVSASDRIAAAVNATYSVTATNAAPTLSQVNALSGGKEDQALSIIFRDLLAASNGVDSNGRIKSFEVTAVDTTKGTLTIGGSAWTSSNSLINADTPAEWTPAANLNGLPVSAAFQVKAIDNAGLGSAAAVAVAITVAAINDAPSLSAGTYTFSGITEDTATAAVDVSSLLASRGSDIEGAPLGVAISSATGLGTWQFSTNSGASWTNFGSVASSAALLLASTSQLRYVPNGTSGEAGVSAPSLSFHAWDGSDGRPVGTRVDVTSTGGRGAFSSDSNTASLTVSAVEDPLTLKLSLPTTTTNNITAAALTYQELDLDGVTGNDLLLLDPGLTLNDPDSAQTRSAVKLLINSGLVSAEDRLELQGSSTPSSSVVNGETILTSTRSLTVDGAAAQVTVKYYQTDGVLDLSTSSAQSEAFWQEVLRLVGYRNDSNNPTTTLNGQPRVVQVEMLADNMFVRRDSNGLPHFYEYVSSDGISWTAAEAAARSRSYAGITGYLATITNQAENDFIAQRLTSNGWIGGSDATVEGEWRWETGPELGTQFSSAGSVFGTAFRNWGSGEPNNSGSGEDYAQMRADTGKWNDLPNQPSNTDSNRPRGYLVEYSSPSVTDITFSKTFNLSIQAGNDAPVLAAASPSLVNITEDNTAGGGQLVSSFVIGNTITDADAGATLGGIAITGLSSGNGTWQYSLNNSGNWLAMGSLSAKQSLLLRPSDAVRFLPDGENATSASFSYRAWDQSSGSGSAGDRVNTAQLGGSTAFSTRENIASISVTAVNDAPVWNNTTAIDLGTVAGGDPTNAGVKVSALVADGSDPDSGAATLGVAVVGLNETANSSDIGNWEVSIDNGSNWTPLSLISPSISATTARLLAPTDRLRFTPSGAVAGTVSLDLRLWDRTSGTAGTSPDPGNGGGTSAYSTSSRSITATSSGITLAGTVNSLSLTEGQSLTPGSGITLTAGTLASARVLIASGLSPGDVLAYPAPSGSPIAGTYDASKGELVLSGSASHLDYQAALRAVTLTVGDDPTQFQTKRQMAYLLPGQTSSEAYTTVTVTPQADAPSLSAASALSYAEGGNAVALHPNLSLSDADDLQIASATVTIGSLGKTPDDLLRFSGASGSPITATAYNSGTGVLSLSGTASLAEYQAALRSITFENTSTNPTNFGAATSRTITFAVTDANSDAAGAVSGSSSVTLNVSATNSAPALSAGLTRPYSEGGMAVSLDAGNTIEISDGDDTNLSGAVLEIINGYSSGDLLALPTATASSTGISGNWDSNSGKLTLSGTTTLANYQTALRAVTFSSSSDDPTAGNNTSRRIAITVSDANRDGNGAVIGSSTSNSAGVDITITPTANAPVVTLGSPSASFTEAGTPVTLAPALVLSDADDTQLAKAEVRISSGWLPSDQLAYTAVSAISGSYDDSTGLLTFTGPASLAEYQTLLRSITYSSSSGSLPASASRTLGWRVLEANSDGLTPQWSPTVTSTVGVVGINQKPVITSNASASANYRENDSAILLNSQLLLSDQDSSQASGASVTITAGLTAGDTLALGEMVTGITPFFDANTGRFSLSGVASVGAYQQALGSVLFRSSSDNPTASSSTRTLSWQITDLDATPANQATSDGFTSTINLTAVNDNPTLGAIPAGSVSGLEDSAITIRYSDLVGNGNSQAQVADVDGTVGRLVVSELLSGSLKLGSSETLATPYVASSNAVIDGSTNAYWTPAAHANGSGANALRAFSVVAKDNAGALSIEPRTVLVNVSGDQRDGAVITKVALPPTGTYGVSQTLDFTVEFDRPVTVVTSGGIPSLGISLDSGAGVVAPYLGGNGTSSLLFRYTVLAGHNDPSGLVLASAISPNGGQITSLDDGSPVAANLTLPGLPTPTGLLVDGINDAPEVTSPATLSASYREGDPAVALNPALALSDTDSPTVSSATVRISAGFSAGDVLALPSQVAASSGVVASWNASTYTLTLSPSSEANAAAPTLLDALRALRSVTYASSSENPTATNTTRTIEWQVSDSGLAASAIASGSFTITPVNDAPTFSLLSSGVVRSQEDTAAEISVQTLAGVSNASDVDGDVTAYVVKAVTSGSLKLGSTAESATDWVAGSNAVITGTTKAFWTPDRDVNGNGVGAFKLVARDNGGAESSAAVAVSVDVTPVADIAQITSVQLPAPGTYGPGSVLQFAIRFDRSISLDPAGGLPSLSLQLAGNRSVEAVLQAPQASYAAGDPLSFAYTVVDGDLASSAGIGLPTSVSLPEGSSLTNSDSGVSVAVNRSLPAANSSGLLVDGVRPLLLGIKEAPGSESNRAEQTFRVSFSEPVGNVDATDFRLTATGSASGLVGAVQPVNAINGVADRFDVTVTEISGLGRLVLELDRTGTAIADAVGNPIAEGATASGSMAVDRVGAISLVAGDDRLSLAEASNPELQIKGTVSEALAGQVLNLWLSSASLTSTPLASVSSILARGDGSWSAVVPKASLDPFGTDNYTLTLKQSTTLLGSRDLAIDRNPPSLSDPTSGTSLNPSLSGGVLNKPELADGLTIKGTTDAEDGQLVDVRLGSINATGVVSNGTWDVQFSDTQVQTLSDGSLNLALAVSDLAGNLTTANYGLTLDTTAQVNLAPIANDGWINTAESSQALTISGVAEGVQDGAAVNLAITFTNGSGASTNFYSASGLLSSGAFSFSVPQGQSWLNGTTYSVTVGGSDAAGNPFSDTKTVTVDTEAPSVDLQLALGSSPAARFLDAAFGGQFAGASNSSATLNAADWAAGVLLSSNASADASTTLVSVNGRSQLVAPITSNGGTSWSLVLSPERFSLPDEGAVTVSATVTDQAGNSASQSGTLQVDRAATVSINAPVDGVGGNHVLNALEAQAVTLSGSAGSIQVDSSASVLVEVLAVGGSAALISRSIALSSNNWSEPSLDFSGLADGKYMVRASVSDGAGNRASASQAFAINTAPPVFSTTAFAGDSMLNGSEFSSLVSPSLSGLVSNAEDGQQVSVSLPGAGSVAGRSLAATVDGGVWNLVIPADLLAAYGAHNGSYSASLSLTNQAGNTATTTSAFQVDTAAPVLTLSTPSDGQWGSAAANPDANPITLSGTATGLEAGLAITVVINGKALIAGRDRANPSQWSLEVPKGVLKGLSANGNSLEVRAEDLAGNPAVLASNFVAPGVSTTPPIIALPANRQVMANEGDGLIRQFQANQPVSWSLAGIDSSLVEINASTGSFSFRTPIRLSDDQGDLSLPFLLIATDGRGNQRVENLELVVRNLTDASAPTTLDPLDQDGIAETLEDAATNGREGITAGDLNNDGVADKLQPNVAAVPWINKENFAAATADPSKALANSFTALQTSPEVRISAVAVRKPTELAVGGNGSSAVPGLITTSTLTVGASQQASVTTPYDPLVFQLQSYDATSQQALTSFLDRAPALADGSDPYPGTQVRMVMDLPGDGLLVNTYLKWNPSANRGVGGWFEFLADGDASTFDNGAELVDLNGDGRIDQIRLTYTDGDPLGGDIDGVVNGMIQDPGMPVLLQASSQQAPGLGTEVPIVTADGVKTVKASFYGGSLAIGSAITTDTPANLDSQQALQLLGGNRTGFTINRGTIGFDLDLQAGQSQASLYGGLDLVGGDLVLTDSDGKRLSNRRVAYYGFNNGAALPLIYNPLKKAGARFYDRSGDGIVDFMTLAMINGGYGDFSGGGANDQLISNSSAAAVVDGVVATLVRPGGDANTLTVADSSVSGTPVNVVLKASLKQRSATSNQIGYVVLDASELANADTVLTLGEMKSRAQTLFSTLEASDVTLPAEAGKVNFEREILLEIGQSVRFFEVSDGTLDEITALSDGRLRFLSLSEASAQQAFLASSAGVKFQLDLITGDQGLNALIGQEQGSATVLDFSGFSGTETVQGSLVLAREASFDSLTGFYRTLDREGSVRDALGAILRPGDVGYQAAAQLNLVSGLSNLRIGNMQTNTNSALAITESSFLAPMATVNGETYFAFAAASSDRLSHFKVLGTNLFGFEDQRGLGDRDFDDLVMGFSFSQIAPV